MRKWNILCLLLMLSAMITACSKAQDTVTVSTTAELIAAIAPDTHIILKSGTYNFSALTEEEITQSSAYVDTAELSFGEFSVYDAPGLILEAEESGSVRLVTENGYANVMNLTLCDGAALKGLIMGHEIEKGDCDAAVLKLKTSQNVIVKDCGLFGCGSDGIFAEDAAGLTVTGTEIYECTNGIFSLYETTEAVFESCRFHDNDGMFSLWGETEVIIKDTEISKNRGGLMQGHDSGLDTDAAHIIFQGCTFRDNRDMGLPDDWPLATFADCDFTPAPVSAYSGTEYDDLIERYRFLAESPYSFPDSYGDGEQNFIMIAQEMGEGWGYEPADIIGYSVQDLNGDGVPELAIGPTKEYGAYLSALFTLTDGKPQMVFGELGDSFAYLQDGSFFYNGYISASENGKGIYHLTDDGTALVCEEFYFVRVLDGDESDVTVYYNTTGSWDTEDSRETDMTLEEFWAWEPEYEYLPIIPFSAAD